MRKDFFAKPPFAFVFTAKRRTIDDSWFNTANTIYEQYKDHLYSPLNNPTLYHTLLLYQ
jgi:hypothetical protein